MWGACPPIGLKALDNRYQRTQDCKARNRVSRGIFTIQQSRCLEGNQGVSVMRWTLSTLGTLLLVLLVAQPASAVVANVGNYDGQPLPGLTLSFTNQDTRATRQVDTSPFGKVRILSDQKAPMDSSPNTVMLSSGRWSCSVYREDELLANQPDCVQVAKNGSIMIRNIQPSVNNDATALPEFAYQGNLADGSSANINWQVDLPRFFNDTEHRGNLAGGVSSGLSDASDRD